MLWHPIRTHLPTVNCEPLIIGLYLTLTSRVGHNIYIYIIYMPYMTVCFLFSQPKIPYIHRIFMVLANPTHVLNHHWTQCMLVPQREAPRQRQLWCHCNHLGAAGRGVGAGACAWECVCLCVSLSECVCVCDFVFCKCCDGKRDTRCSRCFDSLIIPKLQQAMLYAELLCVASNTKAAVRVTPKLCSTLSCCVVASNTKAAARVTPEQQY